MNLDKKDKSLVREVVEIVAVVAIAYIFYIFIGISLGTSTPMFSVVSESMEPTLYVGEMVVIQSVKDYSEGDIVVYMRGSTPIIHRIIDKTSSGFIIKGDNNPVADPGIIKKEQIVGRAVLAFPLLGYPRLFLFKLGI